MLTSLQASLQHLATYPLVKQGLYMPDMVFVMIINNAIIIAHFMTTDHALHYYALPYIIT